MQMDKNPLELATGDPEVALRELVSIDDDRAYFEAVSESREHLSTFRPRVSEDCESIEEATQLRLEADQAIRMGIWAGKTLVGVINLVPRDGTAIIDYWTRANHTGHGYATLGAMTLGAYAAKNFSAVYAIADERNQASIAALKHAGFGEVDQGGGDIVFKLIDHQSQS